MSDSRAIALVPETNVAAYKAATDAAALCREIVLRTAIEIQGRKYVKIEGWTSIAVAHGCIASSRDVERVDGGVRAVGEIRRMIDGQILAEAEGFVGEDEVTWFGSYGEKVKKWKWGQKKGEKIWYEEVVEKRPDYAIRAMAQTRAISRACRAAFAHVVVMMDAGLSTTPAEEVPHGGFDDNRDLGPAPAAKTPPAPGKPAPASRQAQAQPQEKGAQERKSSAQAKKDGDWERLAKSMALQRTEEELQAWGNDEANITILSAFPKAWKDAAREEFAKQLERVRASDKEAAERAADRFDPKTGEVYEDDGPPDDGEENDFPGDRPHSYAAASGR